MFLTYELLTCLANVAGKLRVNLYDHTWACPVDPVDLLPSAKECTIHC